MLLVINNISKTVLFVSFPWFAPVMKKAMWRACAGKTVLLVLQGLQWLRHGREVTVVSWRDGARAASVMLSHQLDLALQASLGEDPLPPHQAPGNVHLVHLQTEADARAFPATLAFGAAVIMDEADFRSR